MPAINSYIRFNGNCSEAMNFYKSCLGGELIIQTIGESPMADKMPQPMKNAVLHSILKNEDWLIMGSDLCDEKGLIKGNNISLMLHCNSEEDINSTYEKLSESGKKNHPPEVTFRNALFCDLTDKFGINWLLFYQRNTVE